MGDFVVFEIELNEIQKYFMFSIKIDAMTKLREIDFVFFVVVHAQDIKV